MDPSSRELLDRTVERARLVGPAARNVPLRISATVDRAAACNNAGVDASRPARPRGGGRQHRRQHGAAKGDRGGDRRARRRRAAVRRGTDQGGARIRAGRCRSVVVRTEHGVVGARHVACLADGADWRQRTWRNQERRSAASCSRRQRLHARIAATLEDRFPEIALTQPNLLALHSTVLSDRMVQVIEDLAADWRRLDERYPRPIRRD